MISRRAIQYTALTLIPLGMFTAASIRAQDSAGPAVQPTAAAPVAADPDQVKRWIRDLDSNRFLDRETATQSLIGAGLVAIDPLAEALPHSNLEVSTRGIRVLRELALSDDAATETAARAALEKISLLAGTAVARRAGESLAALDDIRQSRAITRLERLGAKITNGGTQLGAQVLPGIASLEIDENWLGEEQDLHVLKWLGDIEQLSLSGPKVTDRFLEYAGQMESLTSIVVKRAKITDAGLAHLAGLKRVRQLVIMYTPIGDSAVKSLASLGSVSMLKLYGTNVTAKGAEQLEKALVNTKIDYRNGAFLGIGCQPHADGCQITIVHPESGAAKAGLQLNDVITRYRMQKVTDFDKLTALIAEDHAGQTVAVEILRDGEALTKLVTLGEWN